ncbi:ABC transporter ATP-binding protein [Haloplanus halophilus]|uniref:ABC transporter ATP-binding protein n=1 Tax=Haloplanus halophilus TaxID=2949993 RepID=UPI00203BC18E|nr:ABC transporter ATP-binding protein [Haloplanus sp. GDY1]
MTFFEVSDLRKEFGGLSALDGVSFTVYKNDMIGLIGPNGAGKSTLFNCITGYLEPTSGAVTFKRTNVTGEDPDELARRGLVRTFQIPRVFPTMTVLENVKVAAQGHPGERVYAGMVGTDDSLEFEAETTDRALELVDQFNLKRVVDEYGANISGGQRKLLDLCRALMVDPDLLLLDEPFAGVQEELVKEITAQIRRLNDNGVTVIVIEHGIETLVDLVDRMIVLDNGAVLADGDPGAVVNDREVLETYIGDVDEAAVGGEQ